MTRMQSCLSAAFAAAFLSTACSSSLPTGSSPAPAPAGATIQGTVVSELTMSRSSDWVRVMNGTTPEPDPCCSSASAGAMHTGCCTSSTVHSTCAGATSKTGGLKVTVVGSDRSTTTTSDGKFTLTGVPEGTITLRFEGEGVSATITIGGLTAGQTLTLVVEVAGPVAKVWKEGEKEEELKFVGRVESVQPPTLFVSGKTVLTTSATEYENEHGTARSLADIHIGQLIKVYGTVGSDGVVTARKIVPRDDDGC